MSVKVAEVEIGLGPVVVHVGPAELAEHASRQKRMGSVTSRPSSPYKGLCSCTSAVPASAEPYWLVVGAVQQPHPVVEQEASGTAKSEWCSH